MEESIPMVRVEGKPVSYLLRNLYGYARKAYRKEWDAPDEIKRHFETQKSVLQKLRAELPPAGGPQVRLGLVGDLIWIPKVTPDFPSPALLRYLHAHDLLLGNLETALSPRHRVPRYLPIQWRFNSSAELLRAFDRADGRSAFSALSVANNHVLDFGDEGLQATLRTLEGLGIPSHGAVGPDVPPLPYTLLESGGLRFGFYAATYGVNADAHLRSRGRVNVLRGLAAGQDVDLSPAREALAAMARDRVDFRIVSLHWGYEYELYPDAGQMRVARELAQAGADLIMGHHPHVPQPSEVLACADGRKCLVVYSLGNFLSNMYSVALQTGVIESLVVFRDPRTGRVDWTAPNARLSRSWRQGGGTRLGLVDEFAPPTPADERELARLRTHVGASP